MAWKSKINRILQKSRRPQEVGGLSQEESRELAVCRQLLDGYDRDHVWAFVSGQSSQDFSGNPKYLFVYINRYRPDIRAYWLCSDKKTLEQVRGLGFPAMDLESPAAQYLINRTGVLVCEQVKAYLPEGFEDVKYVNLWHGVGFKSIERHQFSGDIAMSLARKYVSRGTFFHDRQLLLATCPLIEKDFRSDAGVEAEHIIRAGYPRCLYQENFQPIVTYDHDLRAR